MAQVPTKTFALATTATAALAFLLIVPTILVASGVLGQVGGAGTGYTIQVPSTPVSGPVTVTLPVGNVHQGQPVTLNFDTPSSTPLETASVIPDSVVANLVSDHASLSAALSDPTQLQQLASAPAALNTLLADASSRAAILGNPTALNAILSSGLGAGAALSNADVRAAVTSQMGSDNAFAATIASNPTAVTSMLQESGSATALINAVVNNPSVLDAMSHNAAAMGNLLQNDQARQAITSNPQLLNTVLANAEAQRHVGSVSIVPGADGSNVQVSVQEYLPTDATQSAINVPEGSQLSQITLQVTTPSSSGATSFNALKILQISTSLGAGGVQSATVTFHVTQAELLAMGKSASDITLLHQVNGQWVPITTTLVGGPDANGLYTFSAQTPSFSYFAIAAAQPVQSTSTGFAGLGIALLILGVLAVIAIAVVVVMKKKQA
ncbi:MAG: hypothetical protein QOE90_3376 [Thermoplasmata archaeon]|jgi:PGF-pre-PGF domain-containing protein|nr:hypothetical protein [Thermoplasmata archaeon]